jgi:hypothetical protein
LERVGSERVWKVRSNSELDFHFFTDSAEALHELFWMKFSNMDDTPPDVASRARSVSRKDETPGATC